jgi:hypothetical protein
VNGAIVKNDAQEVVKMTLHWQSQGAYQPYQSFAAPVSGPVNAVFQPGFAGTDVQEVRALNAGYAAPAVSGTLGMSHAPVASLPSVSPVYGVGAPISAIFSPGFAGTDPQEVRARNAGTYQSYSGPVGMNSVFSPGFAGTNVQEVRALNAGYSAPSMATGALGTGYINQPLSTPYSGMTAGIPGGINAIFQPGFAGTNPQEVRAWNAGYAPSAVSPAAGIPYRPF